MPTLNKKVLVFIPYFTYGGAEKQGLILAQALKKFGCEVSVWGFTSKNEVSEFITSELAKNGISCHQLPHWPSFIWNHTNIKSGIRRKVVFLKQWVYPLYLLKRELPEKNFDVIIPFTFFPCLISSVLKRDIKAKHVFWNHRGGNDSAGKVYSKFLVEKIAGAKPIFVANSITGAQFLSETFHMHLDRIRIIHNAYVPEYFDSQDYSSITPVSKSENLLQLANFYNEKDIDTLIKGMLELKKSGVNCHLHLAGYFLTEADETDYKKKIKDLDLSDMITFWGPLNRDATARFLSKVHIGVLSSKSEGMPNSVMEYMFYKLPVVASDIPGIRDLLGKHQEHLLFEVGDSNSFAEKVKYVLRNEYEMKRIGILNYERIINEFSLEKIIPSWMDIIDKLN
ncbi:MAG: glycosyltransferase family 4 protein [Lentimicrobium sp.]|nr:glycosyltransferase family 4 protein [Lentimicrobium sp.]